MCECISAANWNKILRFDHLTSNIVKIYLNDNADFFHLTVFANADCNADWPKVEKNFSVVKKKI